MIPMTIADVAHAVAGTLHDCPDPEVMVTGAAADSRLVAPGQIYVAIVGERVDGHEFAGSAASAGAVVTLGSRPTGTPTIVVDDPVAALGRLAHHVRASLPQATVVAVTGSSGKTTTKDLIAGLVGDLGPTVAPAGSLNTEVGLPLTVLQATPETRYLVLEMGSRGVGHVAALCAIVKPDIGVVINVGTAHLGEFGDKATIARAKSEIVACLGPADVAVLNADDPLVTAMEQVTSARVVRFGSGPDAQVRVRDLTLDAQARPHFFLDFVGPTGSIDSGAVSMRMHGEHMAGNAAAAAAVAAAAGMPPARIRALLGLAVPRSAMRMDVQVSPQGITVINDAYNANPDSMRAALRSLVAMAGEGRTFAVLGEMKELGDDSPAEHEQVGREAIQFGVSQVVAVGEGAGPIHDGAAAAGSGAEVSAWVADPQAAVDLLVAQARPGDVVLVKASRSVGLETIAAALLASGGEQDPAANQPSEERPQP
jgi:UDP-N-acetylmuramoyl-tripeptide--D-alanyl-D-alanine ligase